MKFSNQFCVLSASANLCRHYEGFWDIIIICKIRYVLIVAVSILSFSNVASQTTHNSPKKLTTSTCQWVGTVEAASNYYGQTETIVGTLRYEFDKSDPVSDQYKLIGSNLTWSASGSNLDCTSQGGPYTFDVSSDSLPYFHALEIENNGNYDALSISGIHST